MSEVQVEGHLVWNTQQIKDILDAADNDGGIVEVNISHGFEPGRKCYRVTVWRYPRIDAEAKEALSNNHGSGFATPPDAKPAEARKRWMDTETP